MPKCTCETKASCRRNTTFNSVTGANMRLTGQIVSVLAFLAVAASYGVSYGDDGERLLSVDHYVRVHSAVPAIAGQTTQIYVREVVRAGVALRDAGSADRVVLFVHG